MRYGEVLTRLEAWSGARPAVLPRPPAALIPIRLDGGPVLPGPAPEAAPARAAAVLVLVVPLADDSAGIVLTERVDRGGHHAGEMSLPGGSAEPNDPDPTATALREAGEEVGLDPAAAGLRVIGPLETFWIPVSNFRVTPVLAVVARRPGLVASPDEVARVVVAPLTAFLPGAEIAIVDRVVGGRSLRFGAYPVGGLLVWGATARILGQLGAILAPSPPA